MTLNENQIIELGKSVDADEWIQAARKESSLLKMHYYGTGTSAYLTQITGLENADQIDLRKKYAISNRFLCEAVLRNTDLAFSAKGGSINIDASDSQKESINKSITFGLNGESIN